MSRQGRVLLAGLAGTLVLAPLLFFWLRPDGRPRRGDNDSPPPLVFPTSAARASGPITRPAPIDSDLESPGISRPAVVSAADAALDDAEPVIGVSIGGRHRAYRVAALALDRTSHIVNDVLGDVPVSVTHCDIRGCTRLFTADAPDEPLAISQGGLKEGKMVLKWDGRRFDQETGTPLDSNGSPLPLASLPAEETTWGQWRREHPDTDVYVEPPPPPSPEPHAPPAAGPAPPWLLIAAPSSVPLALAIGGVLISRLFGYLFRRSAKKF